MAKRSVQKRVRPAPATAPITLPVRKKIFPEPELAKKLDQHGYGLNDTICELTCIVELLEATHDDPDRVNDAARALNVLRHTLERLEDTEETFSMLMLQIAHNGVRRWVRKEAQS